MLWAAASAEVGQRRAAKAAAALTMMLRALVLAVALAPAARADCEVCKKKHVKEIKSCGAFWTPSKYVGEFAKREGPAPTPRPTPAPCSDTTTGCWYNTYYGYNCDTYDNYGNYCSYYDSYSHACGSYDNNWFSASAQCSNGRTTTSS